jgi:hypothetical protein
VIRDLYGDETAASAYAPLRSVIGPPELAPAGNLVLRVGRQNPEGGWSQKRGVAARRRPPSTGRPPGAAPRPARSARRPHRRRPLLRIRRPHPGMEMAGVTTIVAANHNRYKVEVHEANHPDAEHWVCDLVDPESATTTRRRICPRSTG